MLRNMFRNNVSPFARTSNMCGGNIMFMKKAQKQFLLQMRTRNKRKRALTKGEVFKATLFPQ